MKPPELHIVVPIQGDITAYVTCLNSAEADALRVDLEARAEDLRDQVLEVLAQVPNIRSRREVE